MILDISAKVSNYKCFGDEPQGFDKIYPINIIIGKNNAGKSSLLELIEYLVQGGDTLPQNPRSSKAPQALISKLVSEEEYQSLKVAGLQKENIIDKRMTIVRYEDKFRMYKFEGTIGDVVDSLLVRNCIHPFKDKIFRKIAAERDIKAEGAHIQTKIEVNKNGGGLTNSVREINNSTEQNPHLIKRILLNAINTIIQPDISFKDIHPRHNQKGDWEIFLSNESDELVALSKMGSGIKTILLVLYNLLVIPEVEKKEREKVIFCFEELENNLHPALQRRLFNFIIKYSEENRSYFFITTHSSIVIDLVSKNKNAQIIHVQNNGDFSTATAIDINIHGRSILKDLDVKASDILLSNGVIWVEGPSDAIYLELLIDLHKKDNPDNNYSRFNYTIQSLSTAIWKYAGFKNFDWSEVDAGIENKIISLAKINHNHLLVIDKDDNYEDKKPREWEQFEHGTGKNKARLIAASMKYANHTETLLENNFGDAQGGQLLFWVNDGTFETYLQYFIDGKGNLFSKYFSKNKIAKYLEKKRKGKDSSISKVELAAEIAKYCLDNDVSFADIATPDSALENKIKRLFNTIESWNS